MEARSTQVGCAFFLYMQTKYPNKAISNEDIAEPADRLIEFNFPEHGITVKAATLEEAQEKLNKLIK
jgi:hypothetical protein